MIGLTTQTPPIGADPRLEEQVKRLSAELRCPVCQGLSLQDSPSELAQQMRAVIRDQLASGRSEDEVRQYFVDKYGTWILLEPEREGFSLLVWLLPAGLLFGGGVLIYVVLRKWTRAPADAGDSAVTTQA
jgi:cytochrome c-type biogenesis protein CcmH